MKVVTEIAYRIEKIGSRDTRTLRITERLRYGGKFVRLAKKTRPKYVSINEEMVKRKFFVYTATTKAMEAKIADLHTTREISRNKYNAYFPCAIKSPKGRVSILFKRVG